jgi:ATP-dependent Lon protease
MTGELTLRGKVLPIGGVKEKTLAALRHGIKNIIVPEKNHKDLYDVPKELRKKLKFYFAKDLTDALEHALLNDPKEWAKHSPQSNDPSTASTTSEPRSAKNVDRAA